MPRRSILVFISFILLALYLRRSKGYTEEVEEISSSSSFRISFPLPLGHLEAPVVVEEPEPELIPVRPREEMPSEWLRLLRIWEDRQREDQRLQAFELFDYQNRFEK